MFENLLRLAIDALPGSSYGREEKAAPHVIAKDAAIIEDPELQVLAERYGELVAGKTIEIQLRDLLELIPRARRRSDAYHSLAGKLQAIGVELIIKTSRDNGKKEV